MIFSDHNDQGEGQRDYAVLDLNTMMSTRLSTMVTIRKIICKKYQNFGFVVLGGTRFVRTSLVC